MVRFRQAAPVTSEQARAALSKIDQNRDDLYHPRHSGRPGHDERVQEVYALRQLAHPEDEGAREEGRRIDREEPEVAHAFDAHFRRTLEKEHARIPEPQRRKWVLDQYYTWRGSQSREQLRRRTRQGA